MNLGNVNPGSPQIGRFDARTPGYGCKPENAVATSPIRDRGASLPPMARALHHSRTVTRVMLCAAVAPVLAAGIVFGSIDAVSAMEPAAGESAVPQARPPVQSPKGNAPSVAEPTDPAGTVTAPAAPTDVPAPADATAPADPAGAEVPPSAPADGTISPDMLDASTPSTAAAPAVTPAPVKPAVVAEEEELSPNEAITKAYAPKFRPKTNPGKLNIAARVMFANMGGKRSVGGRMGGLAVDVGQSFNRFGYAVTGTVWGGRYIAASSGTTEINALIGVGPTVGLGRMALLGRGFLDLRAGYDFYYGVVNRRGASTTVKPQGDSGVEFGPARNLAPHGPRVRLDLGLLALGESNRFFHGIGMSMGYQALVGSFTGKMPVAHMLTLGLAYWMG